MKDKFKPCPFCSWVNHSCSGSESTWFKFNHTCKNGTSIVITGKTFDECYETWNRRADEKTIDQHRAEFEAYYHSKGDLKRSDDGYYNSFGTVISWSAWKAALGVTE